MKPAITICGSLNMDFVVRVARMPAGGETISGQQFQMLPGGKGANQACAAGKLSAGRFHVRMVGRTGYDVFADHLKASLAAAGVDVSGVRGCQTEATGTAMIWVDDASGQNSIVIAPGANAELRASEAEGSRAAFRGARYALFQLENPLDTIAAMMRVAADEGAVTVLDPAPAPGSGGLPAEVLRGTGVLTPNETEACLLLGIAPRRLSADEAPEIADALLGLGPRAVVLKLGDVGAYYKTGEESGLTPAFSVDRVIDTTAAGDVFNAALAVALAEGCGWAEAVRFACAAAAISVTRVGAQTSVPTRAEVDQLLLTSA